MAYLHTFVIEGRFCAWASCKRIYDMKEKLCAAQVPRPGHSRWRPVHPWRFRPSSWRCRQRRGLRPVGILSGGVRAQVIYVHAMLSIVYSVGCDAPDLHVTPLLYMTKAASLHGELVGRRGSAEQPEPGIRRLQTPRVLEHLAKFQRPQSVNCRDHGKTIIMVHGGHCVQNRITPPWPRCCRPGALRSRWHYHPRAHWPPPSTAASPRSRSSGRGSRVCFLQTRCHAGKCRGAGRSSGQINLNFMMSALAFPNPPCRAWLPSPAPDATNQERPPGWRSTRAEAAALDCPAASMTDPGHLYKHKRLLQCGGGAWLMLASAASALGSMLLLAGVRDEGLIVKDGTWPVHACMHACVFHWAAKWDKGDQHSHRRYSTVVVHVVT